MTDDVECRGAPLSEGDLLFGRGEVSSVSCDFITGKQDIPFSFLQGLTFKRTFVIADEMQHSTTSQIKLLTTRVGTGTKMVILGDIQQSRSDVRGITGLQDFLQRVVAKHSPLISVVSLEDKDIHRHPLVKDILRLF